MYKTKILNSKYDIRSSCSQDYTVLLWGSGKVRETEDFRYLSIIHLPRHGENSYPSFLLTWVIYVAFMNHRLRLLCHVVHILSNYLKALFICPVLKTEWQSCCFIISEHPPNWSARKLLTYVPFCYKNGKSAVFKTGKWRGPKISYNL